MASLPQRVAIATLRAQLRWVASISQADQRNRLASAAARYGDPAPLRHTSAFFGGFELGQEQLRILFTQHFLGEGKVVALFLVDVLEDQLF